MLRIILKGTSTNALTDSGFVFQHCVNAMTSPFRAEISFFGLKGLSHDAQTSTLSASHLILSESVLNALVNRCHNCSVIFFCEAET
jgi:hypothetical protein